MMMMMIDDIGRGDRSRLSEGYIAGWCRISPKRTRLFRDSNPQPCDLRASLLMLYATEPAGGRQRASCCLTYICIRHHRRHAEGSSSCCTWLTETHEFMVVQNLSACWISSCLQSLLSRRWRSMLKAPLTASVERPRKLSALLAVG
ncbi:Hypothetical predicted protein [Cloeon dipterum]|nr:Hypothetical predicted protein [Cloeon dipterum]